MNTVFAVAAVMSLVDNITRPLRAVQAAIGSTEGAAAKLSKGLAGIAKAMLPVATAGAVLLAALAPGVGTAATFEAQMSAVGAVSRATGEEMAALAATARRLGAETEWAATQVGQAEEILAMAGLSARENIAALPGVLALASATGADLALSAEVATSALAQFGLQASESARVADVLAAASVSAKTDISKLGATLANAGAVASAAGMSLEQVAAMAGVLGNKGIDAAVGGTAIKIMAQRLQNADVGKALRGMGIEATNAAGNLRPIFDLLGELETAMAGMGGAARSAKLSKLFGEEAIGSIVALLDTGSAELRKFAGELENSAGMAAIIAAERLDNLHGALKKLGSAWESLQITVGSLFIPVLRATAEGVSEVVVFLDKLANTPIVGTLLKVIAAVAAAAVALTGLSAAGAVAAVAIPYLTATLAPLGAALAAVSWPVWMLIAVVGVLYAAWRRNLGGIQEAVKAWWGRVTLAVQGVRAVFATLENGVGRIEGQLAKDIRAAGLVGLVTTVSRVVYRIRELFGGVAEAIAAGWRDAQAIVGPSISSIGDALGIIASAVGDVIGMLLGAGAATDASGWRVLGRVLGTIVATAVRLVAVVLRGLLMPVELVARGVRMLSTGIGWLSDIFGGLGDAIGDALGTARTILAPALESMRESLQPLGDVVRTVVAALPSLGEVGRAVLGVFGPLGRAIGAVVTALMGADAATDVSGWRVFGRVIGAIFGTLIKFVAVVLRAVLEIPAGFLRMVAWVTSGAEGLSEVFDSIAGAIRGAGGAIMGAIRSVFSVDLMAAGRALIGTFIAGIRAQAGALLETVRGVLGPLGRLLPHSDAQEGPLSALSAAGRAIPATLAGGIRAAASVLGNEATRAMAGVAAATGMMPSPAMAGTASWGATPITAPAVPDLAGTVEWRGVGPAVPAPATSADGGRSTAGKGRQIVISRMTVNISSVSSADDFASQLQRYLETHDA